MRKFQLNNINRLNNYCLICLCTFFSGYQAKAQTVGGADQILGKWISEQKNVIVEVYKDKNEEFSAKLLWFDDSDDRTKPMNTRTDYKNPDKNLRNRKLIGMQVLDDLTYNPETESWENGMIYDAKSGHTWSSAADIDSNGMLQVTGYWHFKFLGKTMTFKRI